MAIIDINLKIKELTNELNTLFDENWELTNESRYTFIEQEIAKEKKKQSEIVNKNSLIKIDEKEFSLSKEKVKDLILPFIPMTEKYLEYIWDIETIKSIKQEDYTKETCENAKRLRLDIAKIRTTTWKIKDREKEVVKQIWWVTQKCHNTIVKLVEEQEEKLEFIEKYFETKEKDRIFKLSIDRQELLKPYEVENSWMLKLWEMDESIFKNFLQWCKISFEQKKADEIKRIEEEKIAEQKRVEEIKKQAISEYKTKEVIKEVERNKNIIPKNEVEEKRVEFIKYKESLDYDKFEKEDGKIVFYKKVWEFII